MIAGDGAAMYGEQSMWGSKKSDREWGRLIFIFLGVEIIGITCGIRSRGGKMQEEEGKCRTSSGLYFEMNQKYEP